MEQGQIFKYTDFVLVVLEYSARFRYSVCKYLFEANSLCENERERKYSSKYFNPIFASESYQNWCAGVQKDLFNYFEESFVLAKYMHVGGSRPVPSGMSSPRIV